eukprot:20676_2
MNRVCQWSKWGRTRSRTRSARSLLPMWPQKSSKFKRKLCCCARANGQRRRRKFTFSRPDKSERRDRKDRRATVVLKVSRALKGLQVRPARKAREVYREEAFREREVTASLARTVQPETMDQLGPLVRGAAGVVKENVDRKVRWVQ